MKKILVFLTLVLILLLSAAGCERKEETPQDFNFFRYTVDVQGDDFSPKGLTYLMSLDSFLEVKGLDRSYVTPEHHEDLHHVLLEDVKYEGFDVPVDEIYWFQEEMLYGVSYRFSVEGDKAKDFFSQLCDMAKEHLPTPLSDYYWEDVTKNGGAQWESPDGDHMGLGSGKMDDGTVQISFGINVSKEELKKHISKYQ